MAATDPEKPRVVLVTIERATQEATLIRSDGKEATVPFKTGVIDPTSNVARIRFFPQGRGVLIETVAGDDIAAQLPKFDDPSPIEGRTVIYLDQCHWSTLYKALHAPDRVPAPELAAALKLIDLARERKVILPLSQQHMTETCQWTNDAERYLLAVTILQLSGGWQMRDPLEVRTLEIQGSLTRHYRRWPMKMPDVITLEPVLHSGPRGLEPYEAPAGFPPEAAYFTRCLLGIVVDFDVMLDGEAVAQTTQPGWEQTNQDITDWMAAELTAPEHRRKSTDMFFVGDTRKEIVAAAGEVEVTERQFLDWLRNHVDGDLKAMPALGAFRELQHDKMVNGASWTSNDLIDMMYLTCASGYCEHVVAEKQVAGQLRQGLKRLGRTTQVHRNLVQLCAALDL